jgi:CO/xanthine dehydrogenase Mo-binding subunit
MLYAAFVRSPHAHARINALDLATARTLPGVVAVLGANDVPVLGRPMPPVAFQPGVNGRMPPPLAADVVRYAGEPVAVVVADDPYHAADAAEGVDVQYDILAATLDPVIAIGADAPRVHVDMPGNLAGRIVQSVGDVDAAFAGAAVVLRERFTFARAAGGAIEPRTVAAQPGPAADSTTLVDVTVWSSTQVPHTVRRAVAAMLDLAPERVRVVAPDVGGGFGPKGRLYAEEIVVPALALHLGRPVTWTATRREDLATTYHGRGQVVEAEIATRADGTILGARARIIQDCGAYLPQGLVVPLSTAQHLLGPYRVPAHKAEVLGVYTHAVPVCPLRGGGRPQGVFVMERLLDRVARALQRDPMDVRHKNVLQPGDFPYDTGYPRRDAAGTVVYDSGDYPAYLRRARELIGYDALRQSQDTDRQAGRYRGVAVTLFLESTGLGQESARVSIDDEGAIEVSVGIPSQGQGHATTLSQICAARLGVSVERITVTAGDTSRIAQSMGTIASRTAVIAGNAVAQAAAALRLRLLATAAKDLEVAISDLEVVGEVVAVRGVPGRGMRLADVARAWQARGEPLHETHLFAPGHAACFAGGAHAAVVEVDVETGVVAIERYVVVHDCGTIINPMVVEGQIHGGVAHGIGNALYEALVHDEAGTLLTGSLMDYALPRALAVPPILVEHLENPSPFNPEGIKGAGEGGTIGALATIAGAVEDALAPFGIMMTSLPLRPELLAQAVARVRSR